MTSDIVRFWHAYDDAMKSGNSEKSFAEEYFVHGSKGLRGFIPQRLVSPSHLASLVRKYRAYYVSARPYMMRIALEKPQILANLYRYKTLYPPAVFPDMYFVVGALNSAGTSVNGVGLVMGSEMLSRPPKMTVRMLGYNTSVRTTTDQIPFVIAHEFTHYNQQDDEPTTLLGQSIYEGTADFMAEMVDSKHVPKNQWTFGCAHEDDLWTQFAQQMSTKDYKVIEHWLFTYDPGPLGAPPFIGYWMGSRIVQAYYDWSFPGLVDTQLSPSKAGEGVFSAKSETEIR